jgi:hypothetical protein
MVRSVRYWALKRTSIFSSSKVVESFRILRIVLDCGNAEGSVVYSVGIKPIHKRPFFIFRRRPESFENGEAGLRARPH